VQLYFNPATVKMLSNLKVLVIAVLLKFIMRRKFSVIQWEALALLLIGISINQLRTVPAGNTAFGLPVTAIAYIYTLVFVTVPSMASVYNEYALKSQYDTSIYLQNLFLYGYGAIFNFLGILGTALFQGPESFNILRGHSRATMFLICNNAAQGILSSFFFKYADTILKKYSSTVATIFTGLASAAFLGHTLTINFLLGISVVFISMHQVNLPFLLLVNFIEATFILFHISYCHLPSVLLSTC
jgi:drug/metabolite transporter (DMT)-like permease